MDNNIINLERNYAAPKGSLFLQEPLGLIDTITTPHPEIDELYLKLVSMDWNAKEFPYGNCRTEFETASKSDYEIMMMTLAWQWEADTAAANNLIPIVAPFVSDSSLWALYVEIGKNEILHGRTYSEIVKQNFLDSRDAFNAVLQEKQAIIRLEAVAKVMSQVKKVGLMILSGEISRDDPRARDAIMLFVCTMLALERVQFMQSFAITFAFGDIGRFVPIALAVQKICNDEYNVHVKAGKLILANELSLPEGRASFARIRPMVEAVFNEVVQTELNWNKYIFKDGRQLVGCNESLMNEGVYFGATDIYNVVDLKSPFPIVTENPIGYMADWVDINNTQIAPQETDGGNYLLGGFTSTAGDKVFAIDDL